MLEIVNDISVKKMGYLLVNQICENYFSQFLNIGIHSKIRATNTTTYI